METHLRATERHLPYEIAQCYLTDINVPHLNPSQAGRYSIYLPRRDRRLSGWQYTEMVYLSPIQVLTGLGVGQLRSLDPLHC